MAIGAYILLIDFPTTSNGGGFRHTIFQTVFSREQAVPKSSIGRYYCDGAGGIIIK